MALKVHGIGHAPVKSGMRTWGIEKVDVAGEGAAHLADGVIGVRIDLFAFDRAPQPFGKTKTLSILRPFAIHAGRKRGVLQGRCPVLTRELRSVMIGVEDVAWTELADHLLEGVRAEIRAHSVRYAPSRHLTAADTPPRTPSSLSGCPRGGARSYDLRAAARQRSCGHRKTVPARSSRHHINFRSRSDIGRGR